MSDYYPDPLTKARAVTAELRAAGWKPATNPQEKHERRPTMKNAIGAKCYDCMGGADTVNVREEIRCCTSLACALWRFRPYQPK